MNIMICEKCGRDIIQEELDFHECRPLKEHKIIDNILWVSDGEKWYPLKLQPKLYSEKNNRRFDRTCLGVLSSCRRKLFLSKIVGWKIR
jgi:hypothetical protein